MALFGFSKPKAVIGLDIGSSSVKAVELKAAGKGFRVSSRTHSGMSAPKA